jgi:hypothetical protein
MLVDINDDLERYQSLMRNLTTPWLDLQGEIEFLHIIVWPHSTSELTLSLSQPKVPLHKTIAMG